MPASQNRHVFIAANPTSGAIDRRQWLEALRQTLIAKGYTARVHTSLHDLPEAIAAAERTGLLRCVIAAGGDGTATAVANMVSVDTPVLVAPLGTENLLAKHLRLSNDIVGIVAAVEQLHCAQIDAGRANGRLFLVMVGIGFDAEVVRQMSATRRGHIRHWSYAMPIAQSAWRYRFPPLAIDCNGSRWHACWAFVTNVPRYAAGLPISPWADASDGMLDVSSFRGGGIVRSMHYLIFLSLNRHRGLRDFRTDRTTRLSIRADHPVIYQLDGDFGGELPVEIEVVPGRLRLVQPV